MTIRRLRARWACLCGWLLLSLVGAAQAADWPAWRGPARDGICRETGLAEQWPEGGPPLVWKATGLGEGFSTPSVSGRALLTMGNLQGQECVVALDIQAQGKLAWTTPLGPVRHRGGGYPGPRSTPTIDGTRAYALGMSGDLVCLDLRTGRIMWRKNLASDFGGETPHWGYTESVLVDGPWVLCTPGGPRATVVALLKSNGRPVWSAAVGDGAAYASIMPLEVEREKQYVQFTESGVIGISARNGQLLWRYDAPANSTANIATPVVSGPRVFAASGYGTGGGAVDVVRSGRGFTANEAFFSSQMKNHHGGLIIVDGHVYGSDDPGILTCLELASGEVRWRDRGPGKCSLLFADGYLYCRDERGTVSLVEATPEAFRLKGQFEQPDRSGQMAWPHPVISGGRLYLRDQDVLLCYDVGAR